MTDKEARERSGERAMFAKYKHGETGRIYYSFTPSSVQFWGGLLLTLLAILGGMWKTAGVFLRPEVKIWVAEDFAPVIREHSTFATKSELEALSYTMRVEKSDGEGKDEALRQELIYMRGRIDAIADRVGAK